jgi:hypothetical protein
MKKIYTIGESSQTGTYVKSKLKEVIDELNAIGTGKVVAIVSDQGSNYLSARNQISEECPEILSISCAAHMLNLLTGDVSKLPSLQKFISKGKSVVKEIKGSKLRLGEYNAEYDRWLAEETERGSDVRPKVTLSLPSVTRWFGIREMLYKLTRAKPVLRRMSIKDGIGLSQGSRQTLMDEGFWHKLDQIKPLFIGLTDGKSKIYFHQLLIYYLEMESLLHLSKPTAPISTFCGS